MRSIVEAISCHSLIVAATLQQVEPQRFWPVQAAAATGSKVTPRGNARNLSTMIGWMKAGRMKLHVSKTYPLEGAAQALRDLEARKVTGKVVIVP